MCDLHFINLEVGFFFFFTFVQYDDHLDLYYFTSVIETKI